MMKISVRIDEQIYCVAHQIEYWAKVGKAALDSPDLPIEFIRDILIAKMQDRSLAEPFVFESKHG